MEERGFGLGEFLSDFDRECRRSIRAMSPLGKALLFGGLIGWVLVQWLPPTWGSPVVVDVVRIVIFAAFIAGAVANGRAADEFYRAAYTQSCAIALPVSAVFVYAASLFRVNFSITIVGWLIAIWLISFLIAFGRLRRA